MRGSDAADAAADFDLFFTRSADSVLRALVVLTGDHAEAEDVMQEAFERAWLRWPEVREALERLRPLAGESLMAVFGLAMTAAVEQALERELSKMGREEPPARRRRRPKR